MKVLVIAEKKRYEKFMPDVEIARQNEIVYCDRGTDDVEILRVAADAEVILADAISPVSEALIQGMPKLRLIHSEGVAYNKIDLAAAKARGIAVCNNKGANAGAVAEQTILLMLGLLRFVRQGHDAVCEGGQIKMKETRMVSGIPDLADSTVGLIGFGDIAMETAKRLHAFGATVYYSGRTRKCEEIERACHASYLPMNVLLPICDIVSLHTAVTPETTHMVNAQFLEQMKPGAFLINTARGEIIEQQALCGALASGHIAGAGLDTLDPEPVTTNNSLVQYAKTHPYQLLFSPHIAGVTLGSFRRMHLHMWENVQRLADGKPLHCVVG